MRPRAGVSTSEIHFVISKTVSTVRADATEVPVSKHKSSSTRFTRYRAIKCIQILKTKKKFGKSFFQPPLRQEKYAESIGEIRF